MKFMIASGEKSPGKLKERCIKSSARQEGYNIRLLNLSVEFLRRSRIRRTPDTLLKRYYVHLVAPRGSSKDLMFTFVDFHFDFDHLLALQKRSSFIFLIRLFRFVEFTHVCRISCVTRLDNASRARLKRMTSKLLRTVQPLISNSARYVPAGRQSRD